MSTENAARIEKFSTDCDGTTHYIIMDHGLKVAYNFTDPRQAGMAVFMADLDPDMLAANAKSFGELYSALKADMESGALTPDGE